MCASWETPCIGAVLLSHGAEIAPEAVRLPDGAKLSESPLRPGHDAVARATEAAATTTRALVGRTVSEVERELILDTLDHCLGNRTHAANILGISIRTLRNKLREYTQAGIRVAQPGEGRAA
jgi:DNA-binding NtrC family response regulator